MGKLIEFTMPDKTSKRTRRNGPAFPPGDEGKIVLFPTFPSSPKPSRSRCPTCGRKFDCPCLWCPCPLEKKQPGLSRLIAERDDTPERGLQRLLEELIRHDNERTPPC